MYDDAAELREAERQIASTIHKLNEVIKTLEGKNAPERYRSQITLARRRVAAFTLAERLVARERRDLERKKRKEGDTDMKIEPVSGTTAVVRGEGPLVSTPQEAMNLIASARYETGCQALILPKEALSEDFFRLSSGLAGEILQKFVNYGMKLAIVGDFSHYTSKPLRDFIRESNRGSAVFFVGTEQEALEKLA